MQRLLSFLQTLLLKPAPDSLKRKTWAISKVSFFLFFSQTKLNSQKKEKGNFAQCSVGVDGINLKQKVTITVN